MFTSTVKRYFCKHLGKQKGMLQTTGQPQLSSKCSSFEEKPQSRDLGVGSKSQCTDPHYTQLNRQLVGTFTYVHRMKPCFEWEPLVKIHRCRRGARCLMRKTRETKRNSFFLLLWQGGCHRDGCPSKMGKLTSKEFSLSESKVGRKRGREGDHLLRTKNYHSPSSLHGMQGLHICSSIYSHLLQDLLSWMWENQR